MTEEYISLYDLLASAMSEVSADDRRHHVLMYYPDVFVDLARENIKLKVENKRLQQVEVKYCNEIVLNNTLLDKLRWCAEALKANGVNMPFRVDGTPK